MPRTLSCCFLADTVRPAMTARRPHWRSSQRAQAVMLNVPGSPGRHSAKDSVGLRQRPLRLIRPPACQRASDFVIWGASVSLPQLRAARALARGTADAKPGLRVSRETCRRLPARDSALEGVVCCEEARGPSVCVGPVSVSEPQRITCTFHAKQTEGHPSHCPSRKTGGHHGPPPARRTHRPGTTCTFHVSV